YDRAIDLVIVKPRLRLGAVARGDGAERKTGHAVVNGARDRAADGAEAGDGHVGGRHGRLPNERAASTIAQQDWRRRRFRRAPALTTAQDPGRSGSRPRWFVAQSPRRNRADRAGSTPRSAPLDRPGTAFRRPPLPA